MTTIESIRRRLDRRLTQRQEVEDYRMRAREGLLLDSERDGGIPHGMLEDARLMRWEDGTGWVDNSARQADSVKAVYNQQADNDETI